jgi:hypothetical protein
MFATVECYTKIFVKDSRQDLKSWPVCTYYPNLHLRELEKNMKNLRISVERGSFETGAF